MLICSYNSKQILIKKKLKTKLLSPLALIISRKIKTKLLSPLAFIISRKIKSRGIGTVSVFYV